MMRTHPRPSLHSSVRAAALAASLAVFGIVGALSVPVHADVTAARIDAVFRMSDCADRSSCVEGKDPELRSGARVRGMIQIYVSAAATLPLEYVQLEAMIPGEPLPICLERWENINAVSFEGAFKWETSWWPDPDNTYPDPQRNSHCRDGATNHYHNTPTENEVHSLQVLVRERGSRDEMISPQMPITLVNPPRAPSWAGPPTVSSGRVTLQWAPNVEKDVREYRIVRTDLRGRRTERAIDARDPSRQGCRLLPDAAYICDERVARAGRFRYAIVAARPADGGAACKLEQIGCVVSGPSPDRTVDVSASGEGSPVSGATPVASGSAIVDASPTASAVPSGGATGTGGMATSGDGTTAGGFAAGSRTGSAARSPLVGLAAALAFALGWAHVRLVRGDPIL